MIQTLLRRHLRQQRGLILTLCLGVFGFELLIIHIGAAIDQGPGFAQILEVLPQILKDLIRTQIGEVSFPAFPAFGFEHPATMGSALAYLVFVGTIPAGERDSGLADLLLARPVTRSQYIAATLVHLHLTALVVPLCLLLGAVLGLSTVHADNAVPWTRYLPAAVGLWALLVAWGGIAVLIATGARRRGTAVSQLVAMVVTTFLIHVLGQFASVMEPVVWISPFHYFNPIGASMGLKPAWAYHAATLLLLGGVANALALVRFARRDI